MIDYQGQTCGAVSGEIRGNQKQADGHRQHGVSHQYIKKVTQAVFQLFGCQFFHDKGPPENSNKKDILPICGRLNYYTSADQKILQKVYLS